MKTFLIAFFLLFCLASFGQSPVQRNRYTTNVDGATIPNPTFSGNIGWTSPHITDSAAHILGAGTGVNNDRVVDLGSGLTWANSALNGTFSGTFIDTSASNAPLVFDPKFVKTNGGVLVAQNPFTVTNLVASNNFRLDTNVLSSIQLWDLQSIYWGSNGTTTNLAEIHMNAGHGPRAELQLAATQVSFNLFNSGWFQMGAVDGSGIEAMYLSRNGTAGANTNTPSHLLGFQYSYNPAGVAFEDMLHVQAVPIGTNGEVVLRFYGPTGDFNSTPVQAGTTNMVDFDNLKGVKDYLGLTVLGGQTNTALTASKLIGTDANKAFQSVDIVAGSGLTATTNSLSIVITTSAIPDGSLSTNVALYSSGQKFSNLGGNASGVTNLFANSQSISNTASFAATNYPPDLSGVTRTTIVISNANFLCFPYLTNGPGACELLLRGLGATNYTIGIPTNWISPLQSNLSSSGSGTNWVFTITNSHVVKVVFEDANGTANPNGTNSLATINFY